jgi:AraC family transcriptional regulator of adaptative response / DNA-3-methyladenine glycosylase II
MTYSAVRTTGIYCRDGCGGRPLARNVTAVGIAAAAEAAGFRACHQCRLYRSSEPDRWSSAPDLVCRAVQLVVGGALDGSDEHHLAARLGVSARHPRRLFDEHVGATPKQLARSRRAHFARRLLDDTDLSVTGIAYASGFGRLRQMNRVMLEVFRDTPTRLRDRRRRADRLVADGGLELRVPLRAPLAFDDLLSFFAARAVPGVEHVDSCVYRRTIVVDGHPGVIEVRSAGTHLVLRAHLPRWEGLIHVVSRVRRLFDLDVDPARDRRRRCLRARFSVCSSPPRRPRPPRKSSRGRTATASSRSTCRRRTSTSRCATRRRT